jgi:uncharacterized protein YoxC
MANVFGILSAIGLAVAAFVAVKNKEAYQTEISDRQTSERNLKTSQERLKTAQDTLASTKTSRSETEAEVATLTTQKADQEKVNNDLKSSIETKRSETESNKSKLDDIRQKLASVGDIEELAGKIKQMGTEIEELRQSVTSNEAKLANLTSENQEVESRISGLNQESTFVSRSESFPTLKTRISAIYPTWGFVTLAAGNTSGVVTSSPLNVVRDGEVIAKLLVTAVEANTASASIVPDSVGQDVVLMVGDQVVPGEKGAKAAPKEEAAPAPAPAPEPAAAPTASN